MATPMSGKTENMATRCTTPMEASAPSAPIALIDPYMFSRLFNTKFTTAIPACTAKLANPNDTMRPIVRMCSDMLRTRSFIGALFVMMKYHSTHAHEIAWPQMVASALPCTPHPNTMTNRKLNNVHETAPTIIVDRARFGAPAVRMKLFTPIPMHWNMKPSEII